MAVRPMNIIITGSPLRWIALAFLQTLRSRHDMFYSIIYAADEKHFFNIHVLVLVFFDCLAYN